MSTDPARQRDQLAHSIHSFTHSLTHSYCDIYRAENHGQQFHHISESTIPCHHATVLCLCYSQCMCCSYGQPTAENQSIAFFAYLLAGWLACVRQVIILATCPFHSGPFHSSHKNNTSPPRLHSSLVCAPSPAAVQYIGNRCSSPPVIAHPTAAAGPVVQPIR
jgi:hypothetical protein